MFWSCSLGVTRTTRPNPICCQGSYPFHRFRRGAARHQDIGCPGEDAGVAGGKATLLLSRHGVARHKV